jgi:hypothetical protein
MEITSSQEGDSLLLHNIQTSKGAQFSHHQWVTKAFPHDLSKWGIKLTTHLMELYLPAFCPHNMMPIALTAKPYHTATCYEHQKCLEAKTVAQKNLSYF